MIEVSHLAKKFKLTKEAKKQFKNHNNDTRQIGEYFNAITDVSFSCNNGQVLGLLGPNGAGKTTTLRILATSIVADSGSITINNQNILDDINVAKRQIGFLSNKTGLYARLTAKENIEYFAKLHGMSRADIQQYGEVLYKQLNIENYLHRRIETLSSGMYQKVSIARAVIHQPQVLVFDEPTTGLDIMATHTILDFIEQQKDLQRPVIFSTHHLDEITAVADEVAIINQGRTCFEGTLNTLQQTTEKESIREAFMHVINKTQSCL